MNYAAVRSVSMRSLNRQRANIVFAHLLSFDKLLSPQEVSKRERIFERSGVFRSDDDHVVGYGRIGVSLETLLGRGLGRSHRRTRSVHLEATKQLPKLLDTFEKELYILWFDQNTSTAYMTLKEGATVRTQLRAWLHGLLLAREQAERRNRSISSAKFDMLQSLAETLARTSKLFDEYEHRLIRAGWDVDIAALETRSGTRIRVQQFDDRRENLVHQHRHEKG